MRAKTPEEICSLFTVQPQATLAEFNVDHPDGADCVIVPAMSREDDPAVTEWIRTQAAKGAKVIGVCAGAMVVAAAGLLNGKRATTHWYYLRKLLHRNPGIRYVPNRRFVADQDVITTTGITASMPMSLTMIEAIAGRDKAESVARSLGVTGWDARHASGVFYFNRPFALTVMRNALAIWRRERLGIELTPGIDEVSLALIADCWSRTYRSRVMTFAGTAGAIETRNGARILPDRVTTRWPRERLLPPVGNRRPGEALDQTLDTIAARYGTGTASVVAMQLEYPWRRNPPMTTGSGPTAPPLSQ